MPLPGWLQQQAYEDYLAEEQLFHEWLIKIEEEYMYYEKNNVNKKSKNITKRNKTKQI